MTKNQILEELNYISWKLDSYAELEEVQELIELLNGCIDEIYKEWKTNETV